MKYRCLLNTTLFAGLTFSLLADEHSVDTTITEVSLFRDGALVSRQGSLNAPAGKSTLVFKNLPTHVDSTALQANFVGTANGLIRNAKIYQPQNRDDDPVLEDIRNRLNAAQKEREQKQRILANAKADIEFATNMRDSFAKEFGKINEGQTLSLSQAKELAEFVGLTQKNASEQIDKVEIEIKAIDKKIKEIEKELREAMETATLLASIAEVEIEMDEASAVEISISYLANSARWQPQYELRAFPDQGKLDFGYFASVWQHTGEDWSGITLSLQTNQANRHGNVPELHPLHVGKQEDYYRKGSLSREEAVMELSAVAADAVGAPATRLSNQKVAITASTVSFQATIPGQVTVPSSRENSAYKVLEEGLSAEFWSETVPRVNLDAYLRAKIRNTLDLPILPGQALAFVDGKLSSKVTLEKILPEEETEISLGVDGNLIVKRVEGAQKDSDSGFIDKTTTLNREFKNEVTNLHTVAHKVIVVDQFPIAHNSKIEIRRKAPTASEVVMEDENSGVFEWEANLAPKEEKVFRTAYEVVYPRDWNIFPPL